MSCEREREREREKERERERERKDYHHYPPHLPPRPKKRDEEREEGKEESKEEGRKEGWKQEREGEREREREGLKKERGEYPTHTRTTSKIHFIALSFLALISWDLTFSFGLSSFFLVHLYQVPSHLSLSDFQSLAKSFY